MKRMLVVFAVAAGLMALIFRYAGWYADNSALPRYCADPDTALENVARILREPAPAGDGKRRPYLVAAKLLFLVPQLPEESDEAYLQRLRERILETCGERN